MLDPPMVGSNDATEINNEIINFRHVNVDRNAE